MKNLQIKCTRCRHAHTEADRIERPRPRRSTSELQVYDRVCPRCGCKNYYDCTPQVAWCWSSGLIEIGDAMPADSSDGGGAIEIASGPKYALDAEIGVLARHAYQTGKLLVPGVPEADTPRAKGDALARWLAWCGKRKSRDGVVWAHMTEVPT
ncbi:MAG: hypothetical protein EPN34_03110 [Burkholderiaceae bacterium]|nr:MAG: hypothetical protein EPN34_03110 [Burkholderiaceae bacterium]